MRGLKRLLLARRQRLLLWCAVHLAPVRWLFSRVLVRRGWVALTRAALPDSPLGEGTYRRIARDVRRSKPGKVIGRRLRRALSRLIRRL